MDWDIADGWVWALVIVGGPLLMGIFMYVFGRRSRLNRVEREVSETFRCLGRVVPAERIELPTFGLQNRCTTAVLRRLPYGC
jgi:hypothetical protein